MTLWRMGPRPLMIIRFDYTPIWAYISCLINVSLTDCLKDNALVNILPILKKILVLLFHLFNSYLIYYIIFIKKILPKLQLVV